MNLGGYESIENQLSYYLETQWVPKVDIELFLLLNTRLWIAMDTNGWIQRVSIILTADLHLVMLFTHSATELVLVIRNKS